MLGEYCHGWAGARGQHHEARVAVEEGAFSRCRQLYETHSHPDARWAPDCCARTPAWPTGDCHPASQRARALRSPGAYGVAAIRALCRRTTPTPQRSLAAPGGEPVKEPNWVNGSLVGFRGLPGGDCCATLDSTPHVVVERNRKIVSAFHERHRPGRRGCGGDVHFVGEEIIDRWR